MRLNYKYFWLIILFLTFLFILLVNIYDIRAEGFFPACSFYRITGFYCPGCGCTRATLSLCKGRVWESIKYNPIIFYSFALFIWYVLSIILKHYQFLNTEKSRCLFQWKDVYLYMGIILLLANTAIKNIAIFL